MTYHAAIKKLSLERMGMAPFVWMGKLAGLLFPLKTKHTVFLFFPNADIGGAPECTAILCCICSYQASSGWFGDIPQWGLGVSEKPIKKDFDIS